MDITQRIREIRKGTLKWYPFVEGSDILFVGDESDPLFEMLENDISNVNVARIDVNDLVSLGERKIYDYIIAIESLEELRDVASAILSLSKCVKEEGHLILGFNNRLGARYFFGDRDPYTNQIFDGIENYRRAYNKKEDEFLGKCYDKATIIKMLEGIGLKHNNYSLFPDFSNTQLILRDDYESKEELAIRVFPTYNYARSVFFEEEYAYDSLMKNNMLHSMANCLLFDCTFDGKMLDVCQVTSSMGRDEEDAFFTIIHKESESQVEGYVSKVPVYQGGEERLRDMIEIAHHLRAHNVSVVDMKLEENGTLSMPYISAPTLQAHFRQLAFGDEGLFLSRLDEFMELISNSSDVVIEDKNDGQGKIVSKASLDLMPLNCFYVDGKYVFFDQEFCEENYPINAVLYRALGGLRGIIYSAKLEVTIEDLLHRYGLDVCSKKWEQLQWEFISALRKDKEFAPYFAKKRSDYNQVYSNRIRMNFSSEEYLRRFVNIFRGIENKKIILFGSGRYANQFMNKYGTDYDIDAVIDNNELHQGKEFFGLTISSPDILKEYEPRSYRVIICIKGFFSVVNQLEKMGITDYVIYDPSQIYERQNRVNNVRLLGSNDDGDDKNNMAHKKYHTGYIAGVFDLFHVGHLEKFKLAKEQCDYLIVGLVTDEGVIKHKKTTPFVPYEERKAMLEACRYVDEVVEIPLDFGGTRDAWRMYGFDVQFSGSDYIDDSNWLADKEFLEQRGVDMIFFPYTVSTSSSKLKELIDKKLI